MATYDSSGHLDLSKSLGYINELNEKIKEKYPFMDISFLTKEHSLNYLLCLNINGFCISSIEIILEGDQISIDSETGVNFENHSHNFFLRAVLVKISAAQGIKYIISLAKNKLSVEAQKKIGAESVGVGLYETTTLDVSKLENIDLVNAKIDSIFSQAGWRQFLF